MAALPVRLGKRGPIPRSIPERVAARVEIDENGCHIWQGSTARKGYPQIMVGSTVDGSRRPTRVHRALWIAVNGKPPDGMAVHHICENKLCCNLDHLSLVSHGHHSRIHDAAATARKARTGMEGAVGEAGLKRRLDLGPRSCVCCGRDISTKRPEARVCSNACRHAAWKGRVAA